MKYIPSSSVESPYVVVTFLEVAVALSFFTTVSLGSEDGAGIPPAGGPDIGDLNPD